MPQCPASPTAYWRRILPLLKLSPKTYLRSVPVGSETNRYVTSIRTFLFVGEKPVLIHCVPEDSMYSTSLVYLGSCSVSAPAVNAADANATEKTTASKRKQLPLPLGKQQFLDVFITVFHQDNKFTLSELGNIIPKSMPNGNT